MTEAADVFFEGLTLGRGEGPVEETLADVVHGLL